MLNQVMPFVSRMRCGTPAGMKIRSPAPMTRSSPPWIAAPPLPVDGLAVLVNDLSAGDERPRTLPDHVHVGRAGVHQRRLAAPDTPDVDVVAATLQQPDGGALIGIHLLHDRLEFGQREVGRAVRRGLLANQPLGSDCETASERNEKDDADHQEPSDAHDHSPLTGTRRASKGLRRRTPSVPDVNTNIDGRPPQSRVPPPGRAM